MKSKRIAVLHVMLSLLALLAFGCRAESIPRDFALEQNQKSGVVIFSFLNPHHNDLNLKLELRRLGSYFGDTLFPGGNESSFFVLGLDEGRYELFRWSAEASDNLVKRLAWDMYWFESRSFSGRFDVNPGRATYIGEIRFNIDVEQLKWGFNVRDNRETDIAKVLNDYPQISRRMIDVDLVDFEF